MTNLYLTLNSPKKVGIKPIFSNRILYKVSTLASSQEVLTDLSRYFVQSHLKQDKKNHPNVEPPEGKTLLLHLTLQNSSRKKLY